MMTIERRNARLKTFDVVCSVYFCCSETTSALGSVAKVGSTVYSSKNKLVAGYEDHVIHQWWRIKNRITGGQHSVLKQIIPTQDTYSKLFNTSNSRQIKTGMSIDACGCHQEGVAHLLHSRETFNDFT